MLNNSEDGPVGAVASPAFRTCLTLAAGKVNLTHNTPANPPGIVGFHHLSNEFVPGDSVEPVVAPLQFQIGVADPGAQQPDSREARRPRGPEDLAHYYFSVFQSYSEHRCSNCLV